MREHAKGNRFGGADFSLPRRLQPAFSLWSDAAGHRLKPMLQAKARATFQCPQQALETTDSA